MRTNTTLVINPKGGSGKTTVTTNLASYFASKGVVTTVMDYDPQGSTLNWLKVRAPHAPKIHGSNAAPQKPGRLRSVEMYVPPNTQQLIIDAPAGASGLLLQEMLGRTDCILIPVAPSSIDIHATANFIRDLLLAGRIRLRSIRLGVLANRVRRASPAYEPRTAPTPTDTCILITRLSDSDVFLKAAETGTGVFEMDMSASIAEREQFKPIPEWVENKPAAQPRTEEKVVPLPGMRFATRAISSLGFLK